MNEIGKDKATGAIRVRVNPKFYRPTEVVSAAFFANFLEIVRSSFFLGFPVGRCDQSEKLIEMATEGLFRGE